jgi:hypothetical protein
MIKRTSAGVVIIALGLAGCGTNTSDRALSGAGIGAATGALTGAVTTPSQVDLGRPIWRQ